jgi:hypothetical protein
MSAPLASDTRSPFQGHAAAKEAVALEGTGQAPMTGQVIFRNRAHCD